MYRSNNTNNYNPQEPSPQLPCFGSSSNNTNNYNPQEPSHLQPYRNHCSNNTNNYNPQELDRMISIRFLVQIIPITTILKNTS